MSVHEFTSLQMKYTMNLKKLVAEYKHDKAHSKEHMEEELDPPKIILPCSMCFNLQKLNNFLRKNAEFDTSYIFTLRIKLSITTGILDKK